MDLRLFTFLSTFFFLTGLKAQTGDECKYVQVLTFMRCNEAFNSQLKKHLPEDKQLSKSGLIDMNISPWVEFIEFRQFENKVDADSIDINKDLLSDDRLYYKTFYSDPYRSQFLEKACSSREEAGFYLTFSRVVGKTLIVELLNVNNRPNRIRKIGSGVKILFIFNEKGMIKDTLFAEVYYN